jgi:hypothetical protein
MTSNRWYTRFVNGKLKLGIIDRNGDVLAEDLEVIVYANGYTSELADDDELIPLPDDITLGLVKGVAAELLSMDNSERPMLMLAYETAKRDYRAKSVMAQGSGSRLGSGRLLPCNS